MADAPKLLGTDTLRTAYPKVNQAIDNANEALRNSEEALNTANQALANSENTQAQLDQIVIEGDSSVEAAQARVDAEGNVFTTLKERLDTKETQFVNEIGILNKKTDGMINVKEFGASGSQQYTTGSINSGSNLLTVANAIDFQVGQGIRVNGSPGVVTLNVTTGANNTGTITVTLNGYATNINVTSGDSASLVAAKIAGTYFEGFSTSVNGTTVTFTALGNYSMVTPSFNGSTTGVTATISITTQGVDNFYSVITAINGTTITLQDNAPTTYTNATVNHDDTLAIQNALNFANGIKVKIPKGNYFIHSEIKCSDNTNLELEKDTVIELVPGTRSYMLSNSNRDTGGNTNIRIEGGIWKGNGTTVSRKYGTNAYWGFGMFFKNVTKLRVRNLKIVETRAWGIGHFGLNDFVFENIEFDQIELPGGKNGDGITGASCSNGRIENIYGYTNDDMVAIQAGTNMYPIDDPIQSDSSNIIIKNIRPRRKGNTDAWRGVGLYAFYGKKLDKIIVDTVEGTVSGSPVFITDYDTTQGELGYVGTIHLNNILCRQSGISSVVGIIAITNLAGVDNVIINNTSRTESDFNNPQILVQDAIVTNLTVNNATVIWGNGKTYPFLYDKGSIKNVTFNNITVIDPSSPTTRHILYNKNSTDLTIVTKIRGSNINTGGISGEHIQVFSGKISVNSRDISVYNYRTTPDKWDILLDPTNGLQQFNGVTWINIGNISGYVTSSSGSQSNVWTKIASVTLTSTGQRALSMISIMGGNNGDSNLYAQFAIIYFRVQQQNALGSAPNVELVMLSGERMTSSDLKAVITQNDTTATTVELYVRIIGTYEVLNILPLQIGGTNEIKFYNTTGVSTSLPTGTQVSARNLLVTVSTENSSSVPNRTIYEEGGVLKYKDGAGTVKTINLI